MLLVVNNLRKMKNIVEIYIFSKFLFIGQYSTVNYRFIYHIQYEPMNAYIFRLENDEAN